MSTSSADLTAEDSPAGRGGAEGQTQFEQRVRAALFGGSRQRKLWIIGVLLEIENRELISVHLHLSDRVLEELKRATGAACPQLQAAAVDFFASVLDAEADNLDYLEGKGIIQHFMGLLSAQDKDLFTSLVRGLEVFLDFPESLDRLAGAGLLESLLSALRGAENETVRSETLHFLAKCFRSLGVPLAPAQAQSTFDVLFDLAACRRHRLGADLPNCVLKFCKYLFRLGLHELFAEKANIVHIFELFQGFPKLLRTVVGGLGERAAVMRRVVQAESRYFLGLIREVLPTAASTLTLALLELLRAVVEHEPRCILEVWREEEILEELRGNLSIEKDLTLCILEVYCALITHEHHPLIASCLPAAAEAILDAIAVETAPEALQRALTVLERILEFEARGFKRGAIKERAFTHALRTSPEGGSVLEKITIRVHQRSIKNAAQRILGRNFVKIAGNILPID